MAVSYETLLTATKGTIKNCIFFIRGGQQIVRQRPFKVKNPRSEIQQLNRKNVNVLLLIFRQLKPLLYISLNDRESRHSAYNKFLSLNLNWSVINGVFYPELLKLSTSSFESTDFEIQRNPGYTDNFVITWSNSFLTGQSLTDKLCLVYFNSDYNSFSYKISAGIRSDYSCNASFEQKTVNSEVFLYAFFVSKDFSKSDVCSMFHFAGM